MMSLPKGWLTTPPFTSCPFFAAAGRKIWVASGQSFVRAGRVFIARKGGILFSRQKKTLSPSGRGYLARARSEDALKIPLELRILADASAVDDARARVAGRGARGRHAFELNPLRLARPRPSRHSPRRRANDKQKSSFLKAFRRLRASASKSGRRPSGLLTLGLTPPLPHHPLPLSRARKKRVKKKEKKKDSLPLNVPAFGASRRK